MCAGSRQCTLTCSTSYTQHSRSKPSQAASGGQRRTLSITPQCTLLLLLGLLANSPDNSVCMHLLLHQV